MKTVIGRIWIALFIAAATWTWNGTLRTASEGLVATAEAAIGRPATPVSYAGVARRTTVRVATPGINTPWNMGGPVNRVGVR